MPAVTKMRENETAPRKAHMLIGGKWVESASGEWLEDLGEQLVCAQRPIA